MPVGKDEKLTTMQEIELEQECQSIRSPEVNPLYSFTLTFHSQSHSDIEQKLNTRESREHTDDDLSPYTKNPFYALEFSSNFRIPNQSNTLWNCSPSSSNACKRYTCFNRVYALEKTIAQEDSENKTPDYSKPLTQSSKDVACIATNRKTFFDYSENRYILSPIWTTSKNQKDKEGKQRMQHVCCSKSSGRCCKASQFEAFWSPPLHDLLPAAAKRMLLEPSTLQDHFIRGFFSLRQRIKAQKSMEQSEGHQKKCYNTRLGPLPAVQHSFIQPLNEPYEIDIHQWFPLDEAGSMVNGGIDATRDTEKTGPWITASNSRLSTRESLNPSSESLTSLESTLNSKSSHMIEDELMCNSAFKLNKRETEQPPYIKPCEHLPEESCEQHLFSTQHIIEQSNSIIKDDEHIPARSVVVYRDKVDVLDIISHLNPTEMRLLLLGFERPDPYIVFTQHTTKLYDSLTEIGPLPNASERYIDRFSLLRKILALSRTSSVLEVRPIPGMDMVKDSYNHVVFEETSSDSHTGYLNEPQHSVKNVRFLLTHAQLDLLKQPMQFIICQLLCQRESTVKPPPSLYVYDTRKVKGELGKRRRHSTDKCQLPKLEGRNVPRRRVTMGESVHSNRRRALLENLHQPESFLVLKDEEEKVPESPAIAECKEARQQTPHYYCRRPGRPKVNRSGCRCLLCQTLQTPQWRFMPLFGDNWMDLVCNACYMKFNASRPHLFRVRKSISFPQLSHINKPRRPTAEEYRAKGPCAFPHLMRLNTSKHSMLYSPLQITGQLVDEEEATNPENSTSDDNHNVISETPVESYIKENDAYSAQSLPTVDQHRLFEYEEVIVDPSPNKEDSKDKGDGIELKIAERDKELETTKETKSLYFSAKPSCCSPTHLSTPDPNVSKYVVELESSSASFHSTTQSALYYYYSAALGGTQWAGYHGQTLGGFAGIPGFSPHTSFADITKSLAYLQASINHQHPGHRGNPTISNVSDINSCGPHVAGSSHPVLLCNPGHTKDTTFITYTATRPAPLNLMDRSKESLSNGVTWGLPWLSLSTAAVQLGEPVQRLLGNVNGEGKDITVLEKAKPPLT